MRISKLVTGAIAAGTLACSLAGAPFAMASSLLQGIADGADASAEAAVTTYATVTVGNVTAQIPQDWEPYFGERDGENVMQYSSEPGIVQIMSTTNEIAVGREQELIDAFVEDFVGGVPDYVQTGQEAFTLDGTLVRTLSGTASRAEGEPVVVDMAFFIDDEFTAVAAAAYLSEGNPQFEQFAHVVRTLSVAPAAPAAQNGVDMGFVVGMNTPAPQDPADATAEVTVTQTADGAYVVEGLAIDFAEPCIATSAVLEDPFEEELVGATVLGVPFTMTNVGSEETAPWLLWGVYFGPSGLQQTQDVNYYFEDSISGSDYLQPGESATVMLYFPYEGDGTYTAHFEDYNAETFYEFSFGCALLTDGTVEIEPFVLVGSLSSAVETIGNYVEETVALGETAHVGNWELALSADPATYQVVTAAADDDFFEQYAGTQLVSIPVTVTNLTGLMDDPFSIMARYYTPDGTEVDSWVGLAFDDCIDNVGFMLDGATAQAYVYIPYTVDGTYTAEYSTYDSQGNRCTATMEIEITL